MLEWGGRDPFGPHVCNDIHTFIRSSIHSNTLSLTNIHPSNTTHREQTHMRAHMNSSSVAMSATCGATSRMAR